MTKLGLLAFIAVSACARPAMEAGEAPIVEMNFIDTRPATSVSSEDGILDGGNNCVNMRAPGAVHRINVTARDSGGLRSLGVSAFAGEITVENVAPEAATARVFGTAGGQRVVVEYPDAPDGEVYVSTLVILDVRPASDITGMRADVVDRSGNSAGTDQFDLREPDDLTICRGE